tara:strand:+ start:26381 stop:26956 length:576 start_codon:yes stop_codon:yes gene_type:complete
MKPALALLSILCALSCGNAKTNEDKGKAPEVSMKEPSTDWASAPLQKISDIVDGVKFSVKLPDHLKREEKANHGTFPGYVTWNGPNPFLDPTFTAQIPDFPPKDIAAAESSALRLGDPKEVLGKGELAGGGFFVSVAETTKKYLKVEAWRPSASTGKVVRFSIGTRSSEPIADLDKLRLWMESIVLSFEVP